MGSAVESKRNVLAYLDTQDIKYTDESDSDVVRVTFGWNTKLIQDIKINLFFDDDGESIHLSTMLPFMVPESKLAAMLVEVNRANKQYRWIDFYLDDDRTVMGEIDAVIEPRTAGEEVLELLYRTLSICDDVYPTLMKLIYA